MRKTLRHQRGFFERRVAKNGVEFATLQRLQRQQRRHADELHGHAGVAPETALQRRRQAGIVQRRVHTQAQRVAQ